MYLTVGVFSPTVRISNLLTNKKKRRCIMNNELYMVIELKNGKLIEVYHFLDDEDEYFVADNIIYKSLTEFFVNYLDYQPPKSVDTFVKNIEMCDSKTKYK